jgi:UDP-N-acetylglucosamine pyrophosphorylase
LQSPSSIKLAPNGNGSLFDAIKSRADVQQAIKSLAYLQVVGIDNAIGKILDPVFVGYTCENSFQAAIKTVERESETEPVGLVVDKNGVTQIIEYTELSDEMRKERLPSKERASFWYTPPPGPFVYNQAQILVCMLDAQFMLNMVLEKNNSLASMYHKATKSIEHFDLVS